MSELIVIGYDTPEKAIKARTELFSLQKEYMVEIADAVVATSDEKGQIRLDQMVNLWTVGASGGAFWGLLAGLLFFNPLLGVAVGAGAGALAGALSDYGINDGFMKDIASALKPGQAALFLMANKDVNDKVITKLGMAGGHIMRTNLDTSAEDHLRRTFNLAHADLSDADKAELAEGHK